MILDEIGGTAIGAFRRFIFWIFLQINFEIVCFCIGRFFLLTISLGQYEKVIRNKSDGTIESIFGLAIVVSMVIYVTN